MKPTYFAAGLLAAALCAHGDEALERRRHALEVLLKVLPPTTTDITGRVSRFDRNWEDWVKRTGELPPDFSAMPSIPGLPDPLTMRRGAETVPVTTQAQWREQRQWIRRQYEHWVFGTMPPAPDNLRAVVMDIRHEAGVTVREVRLEFGPGRRAKLRLRLIVPGGKGPFPVFLTNNPHSTWLQTAVRRGYLVCAYYATDPKYGEADDSDGYLEVYPEYDFSCLARWAWAGMRAVDYLVTLPEVDKARIGITGHSRNGKASLLAAAFDERIGAVVASSGNTGECDPWRYTSTPYGNESIEQITGGFPHWFHPRLRFFAGREDKLPVDQNMLMALVAPRGLMMYSGYAEGEGNPFGFEQAFRSVRTVYRFLGREQNLWLHLREGEHPTTAGDVENFLDFFDTVFGRASFPRSVTWVNGYSFENWRKVSGAAVNPLSFPERATGDLLKGVRTPESWEERRNDIRKRIAWALGEEPGAYRIAPATRLRGFSASRNWLELLFERPVHAARMGSAPLRFGDELTGDLYFPAEADGKPEPGPWPVVVWLHSEVYGTGYTRPARPAFASLTRRGFAVFAFDQLGFGTRVRDARGFYQRYPKWSLMGKMVADTRAALDAISALDHIDRSRIYLVGYSLGGHVALLTSALDSRVAAAAVVCGFRPLRLDSPSKGTEGIRYYSHLHGLTPRFGYFIGHESRLPVDEDEILALAAPRPVRIVAPTLDRYAPADDVRRGVDAAASVYRLLGHAGALQCDTPEDFNRFPRDRQEKIFDWLESLR